MPCPCAGSAELGLQLADRFEPHAASLRPAMLARLLISCADRPGIVAAVSRFLYERGANIVAVRPAHDRPRGRDASSCAWSSADGRSDAEAFERRFAREWRSRSRWAGACADARGPSASAILVSREDHCLLDLLWRWRRGELDADIAARDLQPPRPRGRRGGASACRSTTCRSRPTRSPRPRRGCSSCSPARCRPGRARALHADPLARLPRRGRRAGHQHPPLVPAGLRGRRPYRRRSSAA